MGEDLPRWSRYEWDAAKAGANLAKHGIDFDDAIAVFEGPVLHGRSDRGGEPRWVAVGAVAGREIAVVFTVRREVCRIISARRARSHERKAYRQAVG